MVAAVEVVVVVAPSLAVLVVVALVGPVAVEVAALVAALAPVQVVALVVVVVMAVAIYSAMTRATEAPAMVTALVRKMAAVGTSTLSTGAHVGPTTTLMAATAQVWSTMTLAPITTAAPGSREATAATRQLSRTRSQAAPPASRTRVSRTSWRRCRRQQGSWRWRRSRCRRLWSRLWSRRCCRHGLPSVWSCRPRLRQPLRPLPRYGLLLP
jgi:hypothetical protein